MAGRALDVVFTEQQLELVDRLAAEWGTSGPDAITRAIASQLTSPPKPPTGGLAGEDLATPVYGRQRYEEVLQPVSGKAVQVRRGEVLKITQIDGGQCVDFNAFNLDDYKEHMSVGHSRGVGIRLVEGDVLVSNPPRHRPMLFIAAMPASCSTDTLGARCHAPLFEQLLGFDFHTNCQDTFAEAIREFDLTPDDVHDSFNMFMNTRWNDRGSWWIEWNTGQPGDTVDLLACIDTLCVPIVCGSGDAALTSNFFLKPIKIGVLEASDSTLSLVERIDERYAAPKSRQALGDFAVKSIRTTRKLERNPSYSANYRRFPLARTLVALSIDEGLHDQLVSLQRSGFGVDIADTARRVFMMWFLANRSGSAGRRNFPGNERLTPLTR